MGNPLIVLSKCMTSTLAPPPTRELTSPSDSLPAVISVFVSALLQQVWKSVLRGHAQDYKPSLIVKLNEFTSSECHLDYKVDTKARWMGRADPLFPQIVHGRWQHRFVSSFYDALKTSGRQGFRSQKTNRKSTSLSITIRWLVLRASYLLAVFVRPSGSRL